MITHKILLIVLSFMFLFSCKNNSSEKLEVDNKSNEKKVENIKEKTTYKGKFDFGFVSSNRYILLDTLVSDDLSIGEASNLINYADGRFTAQKDIDYDLLPEEYKDLINSEIKVGASSGEFYTVKIKSIKMIAECIPHFGTLQNWSGEYTDNGEYNDAEKSAELWDMGSYYLVAEFEEVKYEQIIFAVPMDSKAKIYPEVEAQELDNTDNYRTQIIDNLSSTEIFKANQEEYENSESATDEKWWNNNETWELYSYIPGENNEFYVALYLVGGNPCGGDYFFSTFSVTKFKKGSLVENMYFEELGYYLVLAIDLNDDGVLEYIVEDFFGRRILLFLGDHDWEELYEWTIPYLDCPC
ncbi:MAG: hypothetical protein JXL97_16970 [Bacteroidales bacterium]|nr:hypothetical protein [Bacteroidales bacterium]